MKKKKVVLLILLTLLLCAELGFCAVMESKGKENGNISEIVETGMVDEERSGDDFVEKDVTTESSTETDTTEQPENELVVAEPERETATPAETDAAANSATEPEKETAAPAETDAATNSATEPQIPETEAVDDELTAPTMSSNNLGEWT